MLILLREHVKIIWVQVRRIRGRLQSFHIVLC